MPHSRKKSPRLVAAIALGGAISSIESDGRYNLLRRVTRSGDRAYGRYQVMGSNIPAWTEAAGLGRMTPEQFLASPEAQDAVFRNRFGQYVEKYGPEGAARAWFAGEGDMNNPNARDQLGTTVAEYARRFNEGVGGANAAPGAAADGLSPETAPQGACDGCRRS